VQKQIRLFSEKSYLANHEINAEVNEKSKRGHFSLLPPYIYPGGFRPRDPQLLSGKLYHSTTPPRRGNLIIFAKIVDFFGRSIF
jgi:hypothetical protein